MFSAMHYITFAEGVADADALIEEIRTAAAAVSDVYLVGVPHEGSTNAGNVICKLGFANRDAYDQAKAGQAWADLYAILDDASRVANVEFGAYDAGVFDISNPDATNCVHRVLMFADQERAKPEDVEMLDRLFTHFADYVPMLNWRVATCVESSGSRDWKHIWEQDYESLDIFNGQYMFTPFHPTYVDTYFDTECHNWTADPYLCTMTVDEDEAFLGKYAS